MANDEFNGSLLTWPTTATTVGTGLRDASYAETGADVDLSVTTSSTGEERPGITIKELTATVLGHCTAATLQHGSTGTITLDIAGDEDTISITPAYISNRTRSGSKDGEVTTSFSFRPRAAS